MGNKDSNSLSNTNTNVIKTDELIIEGHLLRWENVTVQISNISSITAWNAKSPDFPIGAVVLIVFSIISFAMNTSETSRYMSYYHRVSIFTPLGVVLLVIAGILIFNWSKECEEAKHRNYLKIYMNSCVVYSILFRNKDFMHEVLRVFAEIFKDGGNVGDNYYISLIGGKINHIGPTNYEN